MEKIRASPSATGTASQIPFSPISAGRINKAMTKKTKVRKKDSIPDIFPFENAVNKLDAKMLIPVNKKEMEKR